MTRMWSKRALQTIKEDSPWMDKMVTRNLKDAARSEAQIWGKNKSKEEVNESFEETYKQHSDALNHLMIQTVSPTIEQIKDKKIDNKIKQIKIKK